jgi:endonuclease-3
MSICIRAWCPIKRSFDKDRPTHALVPSAAMARPRTAAGRARRTSELLAEEYPGTATELCELDHRNPFELLAATILSAQSTDKMVNSVTPGLFARFPDAESLAGADPAEVELLVQSSGFYRQKTKSLLGMARKLVDDFGGEVPHRIEDLVTLPGVGRKTANVVRSVALGLPGLPVDTHVLRLVKRLDITQEQDPVKVELLLNDMIPARDRGALSLRLILHGRRICPAKTPRCDECVLAAFCPSAGVAGPARKTSRGWTVSPSTSTEVLLP